MYLRDIIYNLTGYNIIPVDPQNNLAHYSIVMYLKQSLDNIRHMVFYAKRPNDVSNNTCLNTPCLEETIVNQFNRVSSELHARWLSSSGYPDIEIIDITTGTPAGYIEVKATARQDMHSPRDFYVSPGKVLSVNSKKTPSGKILFNIQVLPRLTKYKIQSDAPHIMVLVKIKQLSECNLPHEMPYQCKCWKVETFDIRDLFYLMLNTKIEFNTDYHGILSQCPSL